MSKIYAFGDVHFGDTYEWGLEIGKRFLDYIKTVDFGNKNEIEAILVGDLSDKDKNAGDTVDQISEFGQILSQKFNHIYITTGNHEKKTTRHNKVQNAIKFLENRYDNITVYEEPIITTTKNGFKCCFLPYLGKDDNQCSEQINEWLSNNKDKDNIDIIAGHFFVKGDLPGDSGVDFNLLPKSNLYAIGHIHTRLQEYYLGSIWPNKITEVDTKYKRCIRSLNEKKIVEDIEIPEFVKYEEITYPNAITNDLKDKTYIYTVNNCNNILLAKNFYKGNYVRAVVKQDDIKSEIDISADNNQIFLYTNNKEALDAMIKETEIKVSDKLYDYCQSLLV